MESDDKSEIKIKEKLNLHVKKRLQETGKEAPYEKHDSKDKGSTSSAATNASSAPRPKRQKTKNGSKHTANVPTAGIAAANPPVRPSDLLLSPGAANSNDTTNSSINSTDQDGELNDRDTCDRGDRPAKPNQRMDIFAMILNQKKSSLMCDPEVIQFMKTLTESKK
ncbi:uncharacterized protein LOC118509160 [Anopheles stephensi]|uniref:RFXA_RFXANK_bdg domain-containing protein n=1 Tax=Anopheles stephensi TaxID=30069 RepID=A0A182Y3D7_ANOST|nr:uncharacterized protein LOC118509160 [Anopheles stephensi]